MYNTLSNLFFVILRLVVITVHLRTYFYTVNLLVLNLHTHTLLPFRIQLLLL